MNTLVFTLGEHRSQLTLKISTYPNGNLAIKLYEKDHGILIFWETLTTNLTGIRPDHCAFINIKAADGLFRPGCQPITLRNLPGKFLNRMAAFTLNTCFMAKNWMAWTMRGTPSTSGIRKASWGAALSGCILPCAGWHEKSTGSATLITAAGGVQMGFPPPCPSGSRHLTLLMAANSSSHRKVPHSRLPSAMPMVRRSSASTGVKRTWQLS